MTETEVVNIAACLPQLTAQRPSAIAICHPQGRDKNGRVLYQRVTYQQLNDESDAIARGLTHHGIGRGVRAALMVPPGPEFFSLAFGMAKAGVVPVLVDPGIGVGKIKDCLARARPQAFIGTARAHLARLGLGWGRGLITRTVTVGGPRFPGALSLSALIKTGYALDTTALAPTRADETAAILFTSGSTGPPKGAVYTHGHFAAQVASLRRIANLGSDEIDLPTFPPFALFDPALGMTTIVPQMDFTRPASVDPQMIIRAINDEGVTNLFASPALLATVARWGTAHGVTLPSVRRVISAGAPVPARVVRAFASLLNPDARIITPYGATEALPVAIIDDREILGETAARTDKGEGLCVGRPVDEIEAAIIPISDGALTVWDESLRCGPGVRGEIAVKGAAVTRQYVNDDGATGLAKIPDASASGFWHRMGDLGYLDEQGRLWFCGRKSQRVTLDDGRTLFTIPVEGVFNAHPQVRRSALVAIRRSDAVVPVVCVEMEPATRARVADIHAALLVLAQANPVTAEIKHFLVHPGFPVDIRHNAKIDREALSRWAQARLS